MDGPGLPLTVFALCNTLRILAYGPQILRLVRDPGGAAGVSSASWTMFAAANASTAVYAADALGDAALAVVHAASTACCLMIVALASWRRRTPVPTRAQRSGSPAACRSARKAPAQGSTRSDGSIARRRSTLQNAVRRSTVA